MYFVLVFINVFISYTPHPIGDSIWLEDGALVIGAGNQLYVQTRRIEDRDELTNSLGVFPHHKAATQDIFAIVSYLNGPLPVYHPQFLQQCILAGRTRLVQRILVSLHKELKSYHEEIPLDSFLGIPLEVLYDPDEEQGILDKRISNSESYFDNYTSEDELSTFGEPLAASLCELLTKIPIPYLTGSEQMNLAAITECVAQVDKHRRSIDENGARYLLFFRQYILQRDRKLHSTAEAGLSWREIVWAFHSVSQEILVDLVSSAHKNRMLWSGARESGMFMWLRDAESVVSLRELITLTKKLTTFGLSGNNGRFWPEITTHGTTNGIPSTVPCTILLFIRRMSSSASGALPTVTRNKP